MRASIDIVEITTETVDELAAARRLRAECDQIGRCLLAAHENGDAPLPLALTHKRARFTACLLDTLVNAAL